MTSHHKTGPVPDPAWLEQQYDNRRRVPTFAQHIERWRLSSANARKRMASHLDVPFLDGATLALDVFPSARPNAPVLVFIHGGYWRTLDKADFSFIAEPFVAAGAMVVVPNYDLCPTVTIDTIALQMAGALAWVHGHAARFGGDAADPVVVGHSAGGHLAAMLLACDGRRLAPGLPMRLTRRALSISGLYELAPIAATPSLQADLRLTPAVIARASPAAFPAPTQACLHTVVGALESEEFLRHNRLIRQRWGAGVVPVCDEIAGRDHFTVLDELVDTQAPLHRRVVDWLCA